MPPSPQPTPDAEPSYTHEDPVADAALDWFGRLREAGDDPAVQAGFRRWLGRDPRHEAEFRKLEEIWGSASFLEAARALRDAAPSRGHARAWRAAVAAAMVGLAIGAWQAPRALENWRADYLTAAGAQRTVALPDGSVMVLNTDSAVALDFADGRRDIALLRGEAWFDVRRDPDHPFRVSGGFGRVVVKGTAFSMHRRSDSDAVVLERGAVDVSCLCDPAGLVALHPGEAVTIGQSGPDAPAEVAPERALAWRNGRILFENARLSDVVRELSRYHDGKILIAGSRIGQQAVTGNYRLDAIEDAVRTLADAAGLTMTRLPGGLIILR